MPRSLHEKAGDLGLLGVGFPEEVGGAGGSLVHVLAVVEEMIGSGGSSGLCAALFTHSIAVPHILAAGDPRQIELFVRPALAGRKIGALAVTEPDAGSDVARIRTRAVREGDHFVVSGGKTYITSGARADFVTTAVRTGGEGHRRPLPARRREGDGGVHGGPAAREDRVVVLGHRRAALLRRAGARREPGRPRRGRASARS